MRGSWKFPTIKHSPSWQGRAVNVWQAFLTGKTVKFYPDSPDAKGHRHCAAVTARYVLYVLGKNGCLRYIAWIASWRNMVEKRWLYPMLCILGLCAFTAGCSQEYGQYRREYMREDGRAEYLRRPLPMLAGEWSARSAIRRWCRRCPSRKTVSPSTDRPHTSRFWIRRRPIPGIRIRRRRHQQGRRSLRQ